VCTPLYAGVASLAVPCVVVTVVDPPDRPVCAQHSRLVLTTEDLTPALAKKGVTVAKPPYFGS
jgi:hypothetical protein